MLNPIEKNPNFTCIVWQPHKDAGRVTVSFHVSPSTKKNFAFYSSELTCYELLILALRCSQCNQGALPRVSSPFPGNQACFHFISFQQPCCTLKKHLAVVQRSPITSIQHLNPLIRSFLLKSSNPQAISNFQLWPVAIACWFVPKKVGSHSSWAPNGPLIFLRVSSHLSWSAIG